MLERHPIIGVMGSHEQVWGDYTIPLGRMIADHGYHLLTGAGGGVMTCVAEAFCAVEERRGLSIGVIPIAKYEGGFLPREAYPNPYIEIPIVTPLDAKAENDAMPYSRNYMNIMTSHAIVILPGDHGTRNEASLAIQYRKPTVLFGPEEAFESFPEQTTRVETIEEVQEFLQTVSSKIRSEI